MDSAENARVSVTSDDARAEGEPANFVEDDRVSVTSEDARAEGELADFVEDDRREPAAPVPAVAFAWLRSRVRVRRGLRGRLSVAPRAPAAADLLRPRLPRGACPLFGGVPAGAEGGGLAVADRVDDLLHVSSDVGHERRARLLAARDPGEPGLPLAGQLRRREARHGQRCDQADPRLRRDEVLLHAHGVVAPEQRLDDRCAGRRRPEAAVSHRLPQRLVVDRLARGLHRGEQGRLGVAGWRRGLLPARRIGSVERLALGERWQRAGRIGVVGRALAPVRGLARCPRPPASPRRAARGPARGSGPASAAGARGSGRRRPGRRPESRRPRRPPAADPPRRSHRLPAPRPR